MATFYDQIGQNRRNSVLLSLAVIVLLGALGLFIGWAVTGDPAYALPSTGIAIAVGLVASLLSYYLGDSLVLASSGAKEVTEQSQPQLINVVREMAIAANVPMPRVYLIDDTAPNAFATGRDPQHASVAITIGLLQKLDREELQGVMAHELSHVRNYDIRFSLMVGVLVGSIALLADFFLRFTFWGGGRRSSSRDRGSGGGGVQIVIFAIAILLAIIAPIMARLVQLAVSRQREYMADASGVELHPQPGGSRAGAGQDRARHRAARGRQPGHPAPVLREPDEGRQRPQVGPVLDPSAGARPDQSAAGIGRLATGRAAGDGARSARPGDARRVLRRRVRAPAAGPGRLVCRSARVISSAPPTGPGRGPGTGPR